jgi:hypothetical protein
MAFDLVQIRELAQKKEDENWRFREFLKRECDLKLEEIDRLVFETTRRVWESSSKSGVGSGSHL